MKPRVRTYKCVLLLLSFAAILQPVLGTSSTLNRFTDYGSFCYTSAPAGINRQVLSRCGRAIPGIPRKKPNSPRQAAHRGVKLTNATTFETEGKAKLWLNDVWTRKVFPAAYFFHKAVPHTEIEPPPPKQPLI